MKFDKGVWRNESCLDMDLLVLQKTYSGPKYIKLRVFYINRKGQLLHGLSHIVRINKSDFWKWSRVEA